MTSTHLAAEHAAGLHLHTGYDACLCYACAAWHVADIPCADCRADLVTMAHADGGFIATMSTDAAAAQIAAFTGADPVLVAVDLRAAVTFETAGYVFIPGSGTAVSWAAIARAAR